MKKNAIVSYAWIPTTTSTLYLLNLVYQVVLHDSLDILQLRPCPLYMHNEAEYDSCSDKSKRLLLLPLSALAPVRRVEWHHSSVYE